MLRIENAGFIKISIAYLDGWIKDKQINILKVRRKLYLCLVVRKHKRVSHLFIA